MSPLARLFDDAKNRRQVMRLRCEAGSMRVTRGRCAPAVGSRPTPRPFVALFGSCLAVAVLGTGLLAPGPAAGSHSDGAAFLDGDFASLEAFSEQPSAFSGCPFLPSAPVRISVTGGAPAPLEAAPVSCIEALEPFYRGEAFEMGEAFERARTDTAAASDAAASGDAAAEPARPRLRWGPAFAFDGARNNAVLFGGGYEKIFDDTWTWDGVQWTQRFPAASPPARHGARMVYDEARREIVLFGGWTESGLATDTWTWDGEAWTQHDGASPPGRMFAGMAYDAARGNVVMFGGFAGKRLGDTWTWDGSRWSERTPPAAPSGRAGVGIAYDAARAEVVLFGGEDGTRALGETWTWDGATWTLASPPNSPRPRLSPTMTYDRARGRTVLIGGLSAYGLDADVWSWNGHTWVKEAASPGGPSPRYFANSTYDSARGRVLLAGGIGRDSTIADLWTLDGDNTWSHAAMRPSGDWADVSPAQPLSAYWHTMVYDEARENVVIAGGVGRALTGLNDRTWLWDGSLAPAAAEEGPPPRYSATMAYHRASGRVVLFGGIGVLGFLNDTWTWDGSRWTEEHPASAPPARAHAAMAPDPDRGEIVLFGGGGNLFHANTYLGDTWTWDGATWTLQQPALSPGARVGSKMAYDAARGEVVLFGGYGGKDGGLSDTVGFVSDETWTWNGKTWTAKARGPSRWRHSLAYDPETRKVLLQGGNDRASRYPTSRTYDGVDTWEWDGSNWMPVLSALTSPSPGARNDATMVYDGGRGRERIILFGGWTSTGTPREVWTFERGRWSQLSMQPLTAPFNQGFAQFAYDRVTESLLLNGQSCPSYDPCSSTWQWGNDGRWSDAAPVTSPPERRGAGVGQDPVSSLVMFGGAPKGDWEPHTFRNDTWTWDGRDWTQQHRVVAPSPRYQPYMAYDAERGETVLFGGYCAPCPDAPGPTSDSKESRYLSRETWTWDGREWTKRSPAVSPPGRLHGMMAYDARSKRVVLYGGLNRDPDGNIALPRDTWTWDGQNWTEEHPSTKPETSWYGGLATDPATGSPLMFGGGRGFIHGNMILSIISNETWMWNGSNWVEQDPAHVPSVRDMNQLAGNPSDGTVVNFGGAFSRGDTWKWRSPPTPPAEANS